MRDKQTGGPGRPPVLHFVLREANREPGSTADQVVKTCVDFKSARSGLNESTTAFKPVKAVKKGSQQVISMIEFHEGE